MTGKQVVWSEALFISDTNLTPPTFPVTAYMDPLPTIEDIQIRAASGYFKLQGQIHELELLNVLNV